METMDCAEKSVEQNKDVAAINKLLSYMFMNIVVRVVMLPSKLYKNELMPWFVAKDVCEVLGLNNVTMALQRLDDDEKDFNSIETPGGIQKVSIINEYGLYSLVFSSRKKKTRVFKRFVTHEILPSIRKHGVYATDSAISEYQKNPQRIQQLITDVESHKRQIREYDSKLIERQNTIDNYASVMFLEEERKRANRLATIATKIDYKYLDSFNACYIRIIEQEVDIPNVGKRLVYKFGMTAALTGRLKKHKTEYKNSRLIQMYKVANDVLVEREIRDFLKNNNLIYSAQTESHGPCHRELFYTRPDLNIDQVLSEFQRICLEHHPISVFEKRISDLTILNRNLTEQVYRLEELVGSYRDQLDAANRKVKELQNVKSKTSTVESKEAEVKTEASNADLKVCVTCNKVKKLIDYNAWPSGVMNPECIECAQKPAAEYKLDENQPHRKCRVCCIEKNSNAFYKEARLICIRCVTHENKARARAHNIQAYIDKQQSKAEADQGLHRCSACGKLKNRSCEFYTRENGRVTSRCKTCISLHSAQVYKTCKTQPFYKCYYIKDNVISKKFRSITKMAEAINTCRATIRKYLKSGEPYLGMTFKYNFIGSSAPPKKQGLAAAENLAAH